MQLLICVTKWNASQCVNCWQTCNRLVHEMFICEWHVTGHVTYCASESPVLHLSLRPVHSYNVSQLRTVEPRKFFVTVAHNVLYCRNYCVLEYEADTMYLGSYLKPILSFSSFPLLSVFLSSPFSHIALSICPHRTPLTTITGFC
jgi:hypothetical protein